MSLTIKHGDLFANLQHRDLIVHGCNAKGKMNSGFAKTLRDKFPEAYRVYKGAHEAGKLQLGNINGCIVERGGVLNGIRYMVVNAITQDRYGRDAGVVYVDYEAVERALTEVANHAQKEGLRVHLPLIGGGLGNGDSEKLVKIFERVFQHVDATLWLKN